MKVFAYFLAACCALSANVYCEIVTLRADIWCPYNCDPESGNPGFMVEAANFAFENAGLGMDYELLDWKDAIDGARAGKYNGLVGATLDTVPDFIFPDKELAIIKQSFWVSKDLNWKYNGISSLRDKILVVVNGYNYGEPVDGYIKLHKDDPTKVQLIPPKHSHQTALRFIQANPDSAVFLEENVSMMAFLNTTGKQQEFKGIPSLIPPTKIYIAFSPKNPKSQEYAKILSNGISELKRTGKWKVLLDKYHLQPW